MQSQEVERREREEARRNFMRLVFGAFLMLVGGLLIADNLGVDVPASVWSYWPFLLIALGAVKLVVGPADGREGGFWMVLAGVYGWVSVFRVAGLTWGSAWPIFLLGAGLWIAGGRFVCGAGRVAAGEKSDVR